MTARARNTPATAVAELGFDRDHQSGETNMKISRKYTILATLALVALTASTGCKKKEGPPPSTPGIDDTSTGTGGAPADSGAPAPTTTVTIAPPSPDGGAAVVTVTTPPAPPATASGSVASVPPPPPVASGTASATPPAPVATTSGTLATPPAPTVSAAVVVSPPPPAPTVVAAITVTPPTPATSGGVTVAPWVTDCATAKKAALVCWQDADDDGFSGCGLTAATCEENRRLALRADRGAPVPHKPTACTALAPNAVPFCVIASWTNSVTSAPASETSCFPTRRASLLQSTRPTPDTAYTLCN